MHIKATIGTFLLSMVPAIEVKGAIPAGVAMGLPPLAAYIIALLGSSVIVVFLAFFTAKLYDFMKKYGIWIRFINWVDRLVTKNEKRINRLGLFAIFIYVAVPIPGTGTWTGGIIAGVLRMKPKRIIIAVGGGNIVAGFIMTFLSDRLLDLFR